MGAKTLRRANPNRRQVLATSATALATGVAGCIGESGGGGDPSVSDISQWPPQDYESQINIWNWFTKWRDPAAEAFKEEYDGIEEFTIDGYNNPGQWYSKIQGNNHEIDSVSSVSDFTKRMIENDLAHSFPVEQMPGWDRIEKRFREGAKEQLSQDGNIYGIPDTVILNPVIEYNEDYFDSPPDSWSVFWEEDLADEMIMMDRDYIMLFIAAQHTGQDPNNPDDWQEIEEVLIQQRDLNRTYYQDHASAQQLFANEDVKLGPAPASIVVNTRANMNDSINYDVPGEGTVFTMNQMVVPKGAPNPVAGVMFADFAVSEQSAKIYWNTLFTTTTLKNHDEIVANNSEGLSDEIVDMAQWDDNWDLTLRKPLSDDVREKLSDVYTEVMGA